MQWQEGVTNDDDSKPAQMFDWFFNCKTSTTPEKCVESILGGLSAEQRSIFFESFYLDHQVHYGAYNKYTEQIHQIMMKMLNNLLMVKNWIDNHPDYIWDILLSLLFYDTQYICWFSLVIMDRKQQTLKAVFMETLQQQEMKGGFCSTTLKLKPLYRLPPLQSSLGPVFYHFMLTLF